MKEIVLALDVPDKKSALELVAKFKGELNWVKVGMQLFYKEGPAIVQALKQEGLKVFLDLKLHDIPNTVSSALKSLDSLEVDMVNVHCMGGAKMLWAASEALKDSKCMLIGVTQLTSSSEEQVQRELQLSVSLEESVKSLATLAKLNGLKGVVCSAFEASVVKHELGSDFVCVCPGIRFKDDSIDDQARVASPDFAVRNGADFLVMGRSIYKSEDPLAKFREAKALVEGVSQ